MNHLEDARKRLFAENATGDSVCSLERLGSSTCKRHSFVENVVIRIRLSILAIEHFVTIRRDKLVEGLGQAYSGSLIRAARKRGWIEDDVEAAAEGTDLSPR